MTAYLLERAWLGDSFRDDVLVEVEGGRFTSVTPDADPSRAVPVRGLVVPGLANTHSHAFHRALRGRTQRGRGTFWTWRDQMYDVAARLDPETYLALARATYREMAAAGITCVGEFHYLHHQPDGTPYADAQRDGAGPRAGGARGRHPDHPPRHALPLLGLRCGARGSAGALQRRLRGRVGGAARGSRGGPARTGRRRGPLGARRAGGRPRRRGRRGRRPALPRAPLRAGRRERRLPRGVRRHACAAAGRPRTARPDDDARPRHAPDRRRHRAASALPAPTRPSARPPSATSATASAPRADSTTPAPG